MTADPLHDQLDAAARDARDRIRTVAGNSDNYEVRTIGPVSRNIIAAWFENAGETVDEQAMCQHVAETPQVVFSAAAFPGVSMCSDCFNEAWRSYTGMMMRLGRGRPCDGCHQFAEEGKTAVMSAGPMLMTVSLCAVCCAIDDAGAPQ